MTKSNTTISKFLSLVLRHEPETIGLTLGANGWVTVSELLAACNSNNFPLSIEKLEEVVRTNDKQRFSFSDDHSSIRANQGHSVQVELDLEIVTPPESLYHGTAERFVSSIKASGLVKGKRNHVHLSDNTQTAISVGSRYGKAVVLVIASERMKRDGHTFFRSANGVWLTEHVPVNYIDFPET